MVCNPLLRVHAILALIKHGNCGDVSVHISDGGCYCLLAVVLLAANVQCQSSLMISLVQDTRGTLSAELHNIVSLNRRISLHKFPFMIIPGLVVFPVHFLSVKCLYIKRLLWQMLNHRHQTAFFSDNFITLFKRCGLIISL